MWRQKRENANIQKYGKIKDVKSMQMRIENSASILDLAACLYVHCEGWWCKKWEAECHTEEEDSVGKNSSFFDKVAVVFFAVALRCCQTHCTVAANCSLDAGWSCERQQNNLHKQETTSSALSWRRGSVVRTLVFYWRTFPDICLIYGWHVSTLWVRCPLWVNQPGQLCFPSLRGW